MIIRRLRTDSIEKCIENVNVCMNLIMNDAAKSDDPYVQYQLAILKKRFDKTMDSVGKVTKK